MELVHTHLFPGRNPIAAERRHTDPGQRAPEQATALSVGTLFHH
jgi:hypothetical protein